MKNRLKWVRWSETFSIAWISAAIRSPCGSGAMPQAAASARAAAADWLIEQIPQIRGTMVSASRGSLPGSIRSKPR